MRLTSIIMTILIIFFILHLFCNLSSKARYKPIRPDEELIYYLRNYPDFKNIDVYRDSLTYLFLHMDAIVITFNNGPTNFVLSRMETTFFSNSSILPKEKITTDYLWQCVYNSIENISPKDYSVELIYAHEDINPSPLTLEGERIWQW